MNGAADRTGWVGARESFVIRRAPAPRSPGRESTRADGVEILSGRTIAYMCAE